MKKDMPAGDTYWDLLCINGNIRTLDEKLPRATWMLIHRGRIESLGGSPAPNVLAQRKLDLHGKTVIPGFIDSHTHVAAFGIAHKFWLNLESVRSSQEAVEKLRSKALEITEGEWLVAFNWDESHWDSPTAFSLKILDDACPSNPVYAIRVCGHLVAVNSMALHLLSPFLEGLSEEEKVEASRGILRDIEIDKKLFYPSPSKIIEGIAHGCLQAAQLGCTSVHDMVSETLLPYYFKVEKMGLLKVRVCVNVPPALLPAIESIGITSSYGSSMLRIGGVKLFYDGSIGARTALISDDYDDKSGERGLVVTSEAEIANYLDKAVESQIQPIIHAIGDKAIDSVLQEFAARKDKISGLRPRIEHAEMANESHMEKARQLNVIFSMQPNFCRWAHPSGLYETRLGKTRARQMNAFSSVIRNGVRLVFGSDCMPLGPLFGLHLAVNHPEKTSSLNIEDAIRSYTVVGSYCEFQEHEKGTLSEGKLADFVVLSEDPWSNSDRIDKIRVEMTVVGGEVVFQAADTDANLISE